MSNLDKSAVDETGQQEEAEHLDDDAEQSLDGEAKADVDWRNHPARALLKEGFTSGTIPLNYSKTIKPRGVYNIFQNHEAFKGMPYDGDFTRRLRSLREQMQERADRVIEDKAAFDVFRKNHPKMTHNAKGEPRWEGSDAELYLKEDIDANRHIGLKPKAVQALRPEYGLFSLKKFRGHINQEQRLRKLQNYLRDKDQGELTQGCAKDSDSEGDDSN